MAVKDAGKTSTGMQANVAALVSYAGGWITGLIFFLLEKENKFVRFHALQSIIVFGAFSVLGIGVPIVFQYFMFQFVVVISKLLGLAAFILWIILMIKAYQGELFKLPIAGDIAEKNS